MKRLTIYSRDLIYSVAALVCMNGVLQLAVYPYLSYKMGAAAFGIVLSLLAVVSIMASTFGTGANYARVIASIKQKHDNGDYNLFLLLIAALSVPVAAVSLVYIDDFRPWAFGGFLLLLIASILRYYGDVNFRLDVNFKGFFIYYVCIAVGYLAGIVLYEITGSWIVIILLGEIAAVFYVVWRGFIFKKPFFQKTRHFTENVKAMSLLSASNFIVSVILNADKLLVLKFVGSLEVTVFFTATLIGKIVALLTVPLNGVVISHLVQYKGEFTRKNFLFVILAMLAVGIAIISAGVGFSYVFIRVMYPDVFESAKPYFLIGNAGQVFYFISGTLMVVVLRFTKEKYQLYMNVVYALIFIVAVVPAVAYGGLLGIIYALLFVNVLRFLIAAGTGLMLIKARN